MRKRKKGVSPLIAAVLLIAFTMAIAAILTAWISGFTVEQQEKAEISEEKIKCLYINLDIDPELSYFNGSRFKTYIDNIGTEPAEITKIQIWLSSGKEVAKQINSTMIDISSVAVEINIDLDDLYGKDIITNELEKIRFLTSCNDVFKTVSKPTRGWRTF